MSSFRLASLGSGSRGNGTLVQSGDCLLLVDCGFSIRETEQRLARLGLHANDLSAILVTHEHGDHLRGVLPLARRFRLPVYMTFGTGRVVAERGLSVKGVRIEEVRPGRVLGFADLAVMPVPVPHDAREPCQYVFSDGRRRLGVLTDLGSLTRHVREAYADCDALMLECNHDPALLANGPYPASLKQRVGGQLGHLSNQQAASLLADVGQERMQHLVLSHLSDKNNTPKHALEAIFAAGAARQRTRVASQEQGFDWLDIL